jgi:hypothetical protein
VCIGRGYPTPCSDGELVYATTGFGATFCYDLDGNLRWRHWVLCPKLGTEGVARSPIIHGNLLINDNDSLVRCYDRMTGRLLWKGPVTSRYIVSPMVLTIDKTDVLLTAQRAYRLPDGQPLKIEGWKDFGMQVLVKHDEPDVAFFCGAGEHCGWTNKGKPGRGNKYTPPAAVRFSLVGDTLKADVLWHGGDIGNNGGNAPWMLCLGDKFYHRNGAVLDALTGKVVAGRFHRRGRGTAVPQTGHLLCAANGHVYGMQDLRERKGQPRSLLVEVFTVDGRKVAGNTLPHIAGPSRSERWSYGHSFTFADRAIYIRAVDHLVKVDAAGGRPNGLTPVSLEDNRKLMAKGETGLGACTAARPAVR